MQDHTREARYTKAGVLQDLGRFAEAAEIYLDLAGGRPNVDLAKNLGVCLGEIGEREQAIYYLALAAQKRPKDPALRRLLGAAYGEAGRTDLAEREYLAALAAEPDDGMARLALAGFYLSLGRFAEGWPLLDARETLYPDAVPPLALSFPEWRGEPLVCKSVLVWIEQGFGDQIQMSRFVNSLKAAGASHVSLGCSPQLADLFATLAGADTIVPVGVGEHVPVARHDYWSRYLSLPGPLGVTLENLPREPYLSAPADRRARWAGYVDDARIGVMWQGDPTGFNAANKRLPDELARRFFDAGAISLRPEETGAEDFADTAAIISELDLVVSMDTAVAHLAGAMGKPCWTFLAHVHSDWRWLRNRKDSPWYPTMRLYRRTDPHDWTATVDEVLGDLAAADIGARGRA